MLASDSNDHQSSDRQTSDGDPKCERPSVYAGPNKRRSNRLRPPAKELAAVYIGGDRYAGEVLDQSNGGLGVLLTNAVEIRSGARVRVAARRKCSTAIVVRCLECELGSVIGLLT